MTTGTPSTPPSKPQYKIQWLWELAALPPALFAVRAQQANQCGFTSEYCPPNLNALFRLYPEAKEDVDTISKGHTPLHTATLTPAWEGLFDNVKTLLEARADPNIKTQQYGSKQQYGSTALHLAVYSITPRIVQLLLNYGADPTAENNEKQTPLAAAEKLLKNTTSKQDQTRYNEIIRVLKEHAKKSGILSGSTSGPAFAASVVLEPGRQSEK